LVLKILSDIVTTVAPGRRFCYISVKTLLTNCDLTRKGKLADI